MTILIAHKLSRFEDQPNASDHEDDQQHHHNQDTSTDYAARVCGRPIHLVMSGAVRAEYDKYHEPCDVCRNGCEEDAKVDSEQTFNVVKYADSSADNGDNRDAQEAAEYPLGNR